MTKNNICELLSIKYPIIQAGMVWVSGAKLAAASANAGILGVVGAGSMSPELLDLHLKKANLLTGNKKNLAVNVPLLYSKTKEQLEVSLNNGIRIFITSAGSPKTYTSWLKDQGAIVIHATSSPELALKCENAGVDAVIAEGFEAGGHNGRDEISTFALIPQVVDALSIPVIAAGGIADARGMAAALILGASAVQMGTRFVNTIESSAHQNFKEAILKASPSETMLMMKKYVPVRLLKNTFYDEIKNLEDQCATQEDLIKHLGHGRAKKGMLEGDLVHGELEIGQIAGMIKDIPSVHDLVHQIINDYSKLTLSKF